MKIRGSFSNFQPHWAGVSGGLNLPASHGTIYHEVDFSYHYHEVTIISW